MQSPHSAASTQHTTAARSAPHDASSSAGFLRDLDSLRAELRRRGVYEPRTASMMLGFVVLNIMMVAGVGIALRASNAWWFALGTLLSVAAGLGFGTRGHTGSHAAFSKRQTVNRFIECYSFPFMLGVSINYWRYKHIRRHHPAPNVIGMDGDIDIAWPFSVIETKVDAATGLQRIFYRIQCLVLPFALFVNGFSVQKDGIRHIVRCWRNRDRDRAALRTDVVLLVAHYAVWLVAPIALFGASIAVPVYLVRFAFMGYALFTAFAPAHFPEPAICLHSSVDVDDFVMRQTVTTVNFKTGPLGRFFCAGVEYQIEHHLFPTISHSMYPAVSPLVEAFCLAHGYPYRTYSWPRALMMSVAAFYRPKRVLRNISEAGESTLSNYAA